MFAEEILCILFFIDTTEKIIKCIWRRPPYLHKKRFVDPFRKVLFEKAVGNRAFAFLQ